MQLAVVECLLFLLWNAAAAKCALFSAVLVAPLWAFVVRPLLRRIRASARWRPEARVGATTATATAATAKAVRRRGTPSPKSSTRSPPARGKKSSSTGKEQTSNGERHETDASSVDAAAATAAAVLRQSTSPSNSITHEALVSLFRSPEFVRWYTCHRDSLLERVRVRCAQRLWESLAVMVVLLMGMFLLPFFSLKNDGATLWALLRRRVDSNGAVVMNNGWWNFLVSTVTVHGEPLLLLVAAATLFTTAFMPVDVKTTASTALAAFLVLLAEAAMVEHMALGAGFLMLLGAMAWRVSCSIG
ncbi:hypothetical protein TraAM80_04753 [Trypanosoma rangeli]|uniref:Uncharacterized protein n=1 Tax=Trypanosoma rangeli TaxID=5698 RepID=A0A3S5IR89_TRYRA|nr:uncharacterized protein TraAM80_04753 [Trypanosoma rangeli]RNF05180.1 hypothetical protein TraAM80_04753 [Trypanosoma rangeli]|eukprot:RNF05180.1 hypothetical protein TraAM80_04753 [Trypanosoma rangeli]